MDGLTKYITLLSDISNIVGELKLQIPFPCIAFSMLIDSLDEKIGKIQSVETRTELDECLAQLPVASLQARLDGFSWRDFVSIEKQNLDNLYLAIEERIKEYIHKGEVQEDATIRNTLFRIFIAVKGDIPKAINFLAMTAQKYCYSFSEGTVLFSLLSGYGAMFEEQEGTALPAENAVVVQQGQRQQRKSDCSAWNITDEQITEIRNIIENGNKNKMSRIATLRLILAYFKNGNINIPNFNTFSNVFEFSNRSDYNKEVKSLNEEPLQIDKTFSR